MSLLLFKPNNPIPELHTSLMMPNIKELKLDEGTLCYFLSADREFNIHKWAIVSKYAHAPNNGLLQWCWCAIYEPTPDQQLQILLHT